MIDIPYNRETRDKIDFYLDEIERQGKMKFLGIFPAPNSIYFIPITFVLFLILEFVGRFYFIPSLISMYLIFERLAYGGYMTKLAEDCIVDEIYMEMDLQTNEVLKNELNYDKRVDFDKYLHKWEGQCVKHSEAQIFYGKWRIDDFETNADTFYYGADWGFSQDPTALVRCFILDNRLYIDQCAYGVGVDIDKTPGLFDTVVDSRKWQITADSARPETISYMNRNGFRIKSSIKGAGSVADGITYLRGFEEIIIHSRCRPVIDEFSNYCWKTDRITGNILPVPEDKHNHCIDALRYALEDLMRHRQGRVIQKTGW